MLALLGLIAATGVITVRHFMAESYCNTVKNSTMNRDAFPPLEEIETAIYWDRHNAAYWHKRAIEIKRMVKSERLHPDGHSINRIDAQLAVVRNLEQAARLDPFCANYHLQLAWACAGMADYPDYHTLWLPAADLSMARAAHLAGTRSARLDRQIADYRVLRSEKKTVPAHRH